MSNQQWQELLEPNTVLHQRWLKRVDEVAQYLLQLQREGVIVLWRPFHEMNQKVFWWGDRPGPAGTQALYRELHAYLQQHWGLHNLIWVWDMQDFPGFAADLPRYDPGRKYWDMAALDYYDGSGYTRSKYQQFKAYVGHRLMAIGECERLPTPEQLQQQPRWSFFMSWSELTFQGNSMSAIEALYHDPQVLTLQDMPGWHRSVPHAKNTQP
jgi:mannan endo-1,4-beta-mannosidase